MHCSLNAGPQLDRTHVAHAALVAVMFSTTAVRLSAPAPFTSWISFLEQLSSMAASCNDRDGRPRCSSVSLNWLASLRKWMPAASCVSETCASSQLMPITTINA
jgi:hypothetical protein